MDTMQSVIVMVILVLMSAYFSATETAFSSLNRTRLKAMVEKGNKKAEKALELSESYDKLISTILIGNNIVNIALASIGTVLFVSLYKENGAAISTLVVTVVVLIFGEISPKSIAKDAPEKFAMISAPFIRLLIWVFTPLNFLFSAWKKLLSKILKIEDDGKMSSEELLMLVEEVQQDGSIDDDEGDLIRNAIEFTESDAEEILTHRVDIEAVPITADKTEIARMFFQTQFSRLLVYEENIDNVVGVIHLKDFYSVDGITKKDIKQIMTKPVFIQKNEKLNDLLKILQKNKSHIAVVIDEYGGTLGIVTMEDILEELVGEIWDEHDEIIEVFKKVADDKYIVDCSENLYEFYDFFGVSEDKETESVSVGGWVMEKLGKIAEKGDTFDYENLSIKITEIDSHRVMQIEVIVNEKSEEDEEEK